MIGCQFQNFPEASSNRTSYLITINWPFVNHSIAKKSSIYFLRLPSLWSPVHVHEEIMWMKENYKFRVSVIP